MHILVFSCLFVAVVVVVVHNQRVEMKTIKQNKTFSGETTYLFAFG